MKHLLFIALFSLIALKSRAESDCLRFYNEGQVTWKKAQIADSIWAAKTLNFAKNKAAQTCEGLLELMAEVKANSRSYEWLKYCLYGYGNRGRKSSMY